MTFRGEDKAGRYRFVYQQGRQHPAVYEDLRALVLDHGSSRAYDIQTILTVSLAAGFVICLVAALGFATTPGYSQNPAVFQAILGLATTIAGYMFGVLGGKVAAREPKISP